MTHINHVIVPHAPGSALVIGTEHIATDGSACSVILDCIEQFHGEEARERIRLRDDEQALLVSPGKILDRLPKIVRRIVRTALN